MPGPPLEPDLDGPVIQPVHSSKLLYRLKRRYVPNLPGRLEREVRMVIEVTGPGEDAFFNGASVPVWAWWFMRPMEPRVVAAALVHDLLYVQGGAIGEGRRLTRGFADMWFFWLMHAAKMPFYKCWVAYAGVATFAGVYFQRPKGGVERTKQGRRWEAVLAASCVEICGAHPYQLLAIHAVFLAMSACIPLALWPWSSLHLGLAVVLGVVGLFGSVVFIASVYRLIWLRAKAG